MGNTLTVCSNVFAQLLSKDYFIANPLEKQYPID